MKERLLVVRLTESQYKILQVRTRYAGYMHMSAYVRSTLFMPLSVEEKIEKIYQKIINGRENV